MPLYDFRCDSGHLTERIVPSSQRETTCAGCDATARRQFSSRVAVVGPTTDTRGMYRRFAEASAEMAHHADRTGTTVPNLWKQAKRQADAMIAAGENPVATQPSA